MGKWILMVTCGDSLVGTALDCDHESHRSNPFRSYILATKHLRFGRANFFFYTGDKKTVGTRLFRYGTCSGAKFERSHTRRQIGDIVLSSTRQVSRRCTLARHVAWPSGEHLCRGGCMSSHTTVAIVFLQCPAPSL